MQPQWKQVNITEYPGRLQKHFLPPTTIAIQRQTNRVRFQELERIRIKNVHIPELLVAMLRRLKSRTCVSNPDDFVFSSPAGAAYTPDDLTSRLLEIGNELRMPCLSWRLFTKARAYLSKAAELGFTLKYPQECLIERSVDEMPGENSVNSSRSRLRRFPAKRVWSAISQVAIAGQSRHPSRKSPPPSDLFRSRWLRRWRRQRPLRSCLALDQHAGGRPLRVAVRTQWR